MCAAYPAFVTLDSSSCSWLNIGIEEAFKKAIEAVVEGTKEKSCCVLL